MAQSLERDGRMFHLNPQKVEAQSGGVGGGFHGRNGDGDADGGLAGLEPRTDGVTPCGVTQGLLIGHVFRFWRIAGR